jgi:hypothetical protein
VQLVEVDVVRPEPPQRALDRVEDVLAAVPALERLRPHRPAAFSRDHEVVAAAAQPAAEDLLRAADLAQAGAERVDVGGVEERDAVLRRPVEDRDRRLLVGLQAKGHRAEADARDLQPGSAQANVLHAASVCI